MAPALDFGLVPVFGEAVEIFRGQLFGGRALPGEFSRGRTGLFIAPSKRHSRP